MTDFVKMSGAGNDFVVVDNRDSSLDAFLTPENISRLCTRGLSTGADGLLELRGDAEFPFRMRYYNSDGGSARMCGNGGRCIAAFAVAVGAAPREGRFEFVSDAGVHSALLSSDGSVRLWMTAPTIRYMEGTLKMPGGDMGVSLADTGVPHAVVFTRNIANCDFHRLAPMIRSHPDFQPEGANSTFAQVLGRTHASMRTWERGVEGETLACGTGAVAVALVGQELGLIDLPLEIDVSSGLTLTVGRDDLGWWLSGEARTVYSGCLKDFWHHA